VQRGDTLSGIAHRFDTSIKNIMSTNHLLSTRIYVGQRLTIPAPQPEPSTVYVVRWGDTLSGIARGSGTTVQAIMSTNGLTSTRIYVGQRLIVPGCIAGGDDAL
jgi:LysM repeat protein